MNVKERPKNCVSLKEAKEIWQLNETCDSELAHFSVKNLIGITSETWWGLKIRLWECVSVDFLILIVVLWLSRRMSRFFIVVVFENVPVFRKYTLKCSQVNHHVSPYSQIVWGDKSYSTHVEFISFHQYLCRCHTGNLSADSRLC